MRASLVLGVMFLATGCGAGNLQLPVPVPNPSGDTNTLGNDSNTATTPRKLCKRGMASGLQTTPALSANDMAAVAPGISWWYNWSPTPDNANVAAAAQAANVTFVPMVFGPTVNASQLEASIAAGSDYLLGFNEPNFTSQGNLTPQQAAALWPQVEAVAHAHNLKIVSPAVNYCGGGCNQTNPFTWLDQFFAACPNCQVDAIAIHAYVCYDSALSSTYLQPFEKKYNRPIWLTEFACLDGSADASVLANQENLMRAAVADMEADPNVQRYAWFLARSNSSSPPLSLLGASGQLTSLGQLYVSLPQACDP